MALLPPQSSFIISKPNPHLYKSLSHLPTKPKLITVSQDSSSSSSSSSQSSKPTLEEPSSNVKSISSGQGFGSGSGSGSAQLPKSKATPEAAKKKQKGKKERASIIRRSPVGTPVFLDKKEEEQAQEKTQNESAFLLAWLALGCLILVEGIALAASGLLPEEWDKFFVKFLYPSFTPTVFLFVAGTAAYGVFKYLQNESLRNQK